MEKLESNSDIAQDERSVSLDEKTAPNAGKRVLDPGTRKTRSETISWPLWIIIVVSMLSSIFLFALDNTIVAVIQPRIIETFDNAIEKLPWLSVAFPLGNCSLNLVW